MRRERGGPFYYRTEPMFRDDWFVIPPEAYTDELPSSIGTPMYAHDSLYNHFQTEKYTGEFLIDVRQVFHETHGIHRLVEVAWSPR